MADNSSSSCSSSSSSSSPPPVGTSSNDDERHWPEATFIQPLFPGCSLPPELLFEIFGHLVRLHAVFPPIEQLEKELPVPEPEEEHE